MRYEKLNIVAYVNLLVLSQIHVLLWRSVVILKALIESRVILMGFLFVSVFLVYEIPLCASSKDISFYCSAK